MGKIVASGGGTERVYLGLGSNLGDREGNLRRAVEMLEKNVGLERTSSIYETAPWGYLEQPHFLNCVCEGRTAMQPLELLALVKDVERALGREPMGESSIRWGPRVLDVDILFYGQRAVRESGLEVPHPGLVDRAFVLVPLEEIAPDFRHPVLKLTVAELLQRFSPADDQGVVGSTTEGVRLWAAPIPVPGTRY